MTEQVEYEFDVALSFAGEDREFVKDVTTGLRERGILPFFDEDFEIEMWGEDLYVYLDQVYRERARYAVLFVSRHYVEKAWPNHERESAQARAFAEPRPYLLPVRLDDSALLGLRPTVSYLDARRLGIPGIVAAIERKVKGSIPEAAPTWDRTTPRTAAQVQQLLRDRPDGWEYLLLGAEMLLGVAGLEDKYRDHEMHQPHRTGTHIAPHESAAYLRGMLSDAETISGSIMGIFSVEAQLRAFGAPGEAGDEKAIHHLAARLVGVYEQFMDWAADARGLAVPSDHRKAYEIAARFVDNPVREIREFIDKFVANTDMLPAFFDLPEPKEKLVLSLELTLTVDDGVVEEFRREMARIE